MFIRLTVIYLMALTAACSHSKPSYINPESPKDDCIACERITLFLKSKSAIDKGIWSGILSTKHNPPLLYFTNEVTYTAFLEPDSSTHDQYITINCHGRSLLKFTQRLDSQHFHMENKMNFSDSSSMFFFRPMMLCSDVETLSQLVPDFQSTEDWLLLVMHEYFHSFQFSHPASLNYLWQSIGMAADTLSFLYLNNTGFQDTLKLENQLLLQALDSDPIDSVNSYIRKFVNLREQRRGNFEKFNSLDLTLIENFWETIEGTARYVEYYLAGKFAHVTVNDLTGCDSLFHDFKEFKESIDFQSKPQFKERTRIMPAYYYVTGFNICRLMDKLGLEYKYDRFNRPQQSLYEILKHEVK